MTIFPFQGDMADLCSRLGVLAMLLLGIPTSPTTQPVTSTSGFTPSASVHAETLVFSASASTEGEYALVRAALKRAGIELNLATRILGNLDVRDTAADEYIAAVRRIISWIDRPGGNLTADAAALATTLEAARSTFSERTSSLDHWLSLNRTSGEVTVIPARFVVTLQPEQAAEPDYQSRRLARALLA